MADRMRTTRKKIVRRLGSGEAAALASLMQMREQRNAMAQGRPMRHWSDSEAWKEEVKKQKEEVKKEKEKEGEGHEVLQAASQQEKAPPPAIGQVGGRGRGRGRWRLRRGGSWVNKGPGTSRYTGWEWISDPSD